MPRYDYAYQLSDEQLRRYMALAPEAKLRWLDEARRFTLLARDAPRTKVGDRHPLPGPLPGEREMLDSPRPSPKGEGEIS